MRFGAPGEPDLVGGSHHRHFHYSNIPDKSRAHAVAIVRECFECVRVYVRMSVCVCFSTCARARAPLSVIDFNDKYWRNKNAWNWYRAQCSGLRSGMQGVEAEDAEGAVVIISQPAQLEQLLANAGPHLVSPSHAGLIIGFIDPLYWPPPWVGGWLAVGVAFGLSIPFRAPAPPLAYPHFLFIN